MTNRLLKILLVLLIFFLIIAGILFYSIFIQVENVNVSYNTIQSDKIPEEMTDTTIAFISDIHYQSYMNHERLSGMMDEIKSIQPDVVVFGGDMFDHPARNKPTEESIQQMKDFFTSFEAPLGKFAVLGEHDLEGEESKQIITDILVSSDFEIITNTSLTIRNNSFSGITLIGVDSIINGTLDIDSAFSSLSSDQFNLLVTHCPDVVREAGFPTQPLDLILAGHSHGGQLYIPILGPLDIKDGSKKYNHGIKNINRTTTIHVSNGLGTTDSDIRLFSPPQVVVYRLEHTSSNVAENQ